MGIKERGDIKSLIDDYTDKLKNGELSYSDLGAERDWAIGNKNKYEDVIQDRRRELIEWLEYDTECSEAQISEFNQVLGSYIDNRLVMSNPQQSYEDLVEALKIISSDGDEKEFYVSEPVYLLEIITDIGRKIKEKSRRIESINTVLFESRHGDDKQEGT